MLVILLLGLWLSHERWRLSQRALFQHGIIGSDERTCPCDGAFCAFWGELVLCFLMLAFSVSRCWLSLLGQVRYTPQGFVAFVRGESIVSWRSFLGFSSDLASRDLVALCK